MSLTVSNLAKEYYNIYSLTNSEKYKADRVDASEVSKDAFGISDMKSAFEAMADASDTGFASMGSVSGYVDNMFRLSQSGIFSRLNHSGSVIRDLLSGHDTSSMYDVLSGEAQNSHTLSSVINAYSGSVSTYSSYLKENALNTSI
jgi:hypothetical protein